MGPMAARPTFRRSLAVVWRSLRSMRTALILLLLLALAPIAGSLVPQRGISDNRILQMFIEHPLRAQFYEYAGLFDVFGSWWFTLIYSLLFVSLIACLVPRTRATWRAVRARPQPVRELESMRHVATRTVTRTPEEALARAERVLRRRLFRVARVQGPGGMPQVAAEKGAAREVGSLLFHWAFILILLGALWGKGTGFSGYAVIVEGETWIEEHQSYDGQIREGSAFDEGHAGIQATLQDFTVTYRETGMAKDFVSTIDFTQPARDGEEAETQRAVAVRVNSPATVGHVRFYQFGYGWAPVIRVADAEGEALFDGPLTFAQDSAPEGVNQLQMPWTGAVKLPGLRPQQGIEFTLYSSPEAALASVQSETPMPVINPRNPVLTFRVYEGDLRLEAPQRSTELETSGMREIDSGVVVVGGTATTSDASGSLLIGFPELREYTVLQVNRDRGTGIMLLAAILILIGLLPALFSARRKIWVQARPDNKSTGTILEVGGFALQRREQFEEAFAGLVDAIAKTAAEEGTS